MVFVANQDRNSWRWMANLSLNVGNTWRIKLKTSLPNYPTWVVTMRMDLETRHRRQYLAQAHANRRVSIFKLDILEFQCCLQPKEFTVIEKNRKFQQKKYLGRWQRWCLERQMRL
jgi:hypothetical protein